MSDTELCGCGRAPRHKGMCKFKIARLEATGRKFMPGPKKDRSERRAVNPAGAQKAPTEREAGKNPSGLQEIPPAREVEPPAPTELMSILRPDTNDRRPRKTIDIRYLELSGRFLHPDGEAAAFQKMSAGYFSKMMKKKDPQSGLTYRELFTNARLHGRAMLLKIARDHCEEKGSAGVQMTKFMLENEFGFSERRLEETRGQVKHTHTHEHKAIPSDEELGKLSDTELQNLATQVAGGAGKSMTKH